MTLFANFYIFGFVFFVSSLFGINRQRNVPKLENYPAKLDGTSPDT